MCDPDCGDCLRHSDPPRGEPEAAGLPARRAFLLMGLGALLAGCAPKTTRLTTLPGPIWRPRALPAEETIATGAAPPYGKIIARGEWARGSPVSALMQRMLPVRHITVHHDGMEPFFASDQVSTAMRLEDIRRAHRGRDWGDIGYHYAIDRDGRVWEARPLAWQGAHVKDNNEGNLGIVALGNFDRQSPTPAQLQSLNMLVSRFMSEFNVPVARVLTHQEWPDARTACPGVHLQRYMSAIRRNKQLG